MEKVFAYKCQFCNKLYNTPSSCKNHEYRCYFNPKTRSCASCAFFRYEKQTYKPGHEINFQSCIVNIPIGKKELKTRCNKYLNTQYKEDSEIMDLVFKEYDIEKHLFDAVSRFNNN